MESGFCSWLSGRNDFVAVNFLQDLAGAALQKFLRNLDTKLRGFSGWRSLDLAEDFASIRPAYHCAQAQLAANILRVRADRHLAAASETSQQLAFALNRLSCRNVIQKFQSFHNVRVAAPRFNCQR